MTAVADTAWAALDAPGKRTRVLRVAGELFSRDGIDVPMPVLADAVGVGVGSIYRQLGRKDDIVAALVVDRLELACTLMERALEHPDPWRALCEVTDAVVGDALGDHVTREAWAASSQHPAVLAVRPRAAAATEALVRRAANAGALREDASADDLRLAFCAARSVEDLGPGGALRLARLVLRGMSADGTTP